MQQELEVKGNRVLVLHAEVDGQGVGRKLHGVDQLGSVRPVLLVLGRQLRRAQSEGEQNLGSVLLWSVAGIRPCAVPREAVRRQFGGLVIFWCCAKVGEYNWDATTDPCGAVESRSCRQEELFVAVTRHPGCDCRSVEVDCDGVSAGQRGLNSVFALHNHHGGWSFPCE